MCKWCLCFLGEGNPGQVPYRGHRKGRGGSQSRQRGCGVRGSLATRGLIWRCGLSCSSYEAYSGQLLSATWSCPAHLSRRWMDAWQCCVSCLWASSWPRRSTCSCALSCRSLCEVRSSCRYPDSCSRSPAASSWEDSSLRHSSCRGSGTHSEHQQPSRAPQFPQKGNSDT